ncbi:MAG: Dabb family protein [Deltaproteobacteria bacterium]|nr:Dabb family protein [Deltaproteobacteria bacterium]
MQNDLPSERREALHIYQNNPAHETMKLFIKEVHSGRRVIDYEV